MKHIFKRRHEAVTAIRTAGYRCRGADMRSPADSEKWANGAGDIAIIKAEPDGSYSLTQETA